MSLSADTQSEELNKDAAQATVEPAPARADGELRLVDLLLVLAKSRWMIIRATLVGGVLAALWSLTLPNIYVATSRILPHQTQSTASAFLAQMSSSSSAAAALTKSPSDIYVALLKSRSVADALIVHYGLQSVYKSSQMSSVRQSLAEDSSISTSAGSDGLVEIAVSSRDPELAAALANGYVGALKTLLSSLAVTEASQRRLFFENQFRNAKEDLSRAEVAMKELKLTTGLIQIDGQVKASIEAASSLKAQIAAQEVQLGTMKSFETDRNAEVGRTEDTLAGLRAQLAKLERGDAVHSGGDISIPTKSAPSVEFEYIRRMRDLKYYEDLYEIMGKQYESAKLDEAKDFASVQVVDTAVKPDKKDRPKRSMIVLFAMLLGGVLAGVYAFIREATRHELHDPEQAARWHELASFCRIPVWRFARKR